MRITLEPYWVRIARRARLFWERPTGVVERGVRFLWACFPPALGIATGIATGMALWRSTGHFLVGIAVSVSLAVLLGGAALLHAARV